MFKRIAYLILLVALGLCQALTAQTLTCYEYWFDDDYDGRITDANASESLKFEVDASNLTWGMHTFHFRAINDQEEKSAPLTRWVYLFDKAQIPDVGLANYEYWIDDDYTHRTTGSLSGEQYTLSLNISTEGLTQDMHLLHMRMSNQEGQWSETRHYAFYCLTSQPDPSPKKIASYEYWYDDDFAHRVSREIASTFIMFEADLSALSSGLHFMHLHVSNNLGQWSEPRSYMLYTLDPTPQDQDLAIVGYRYLFNGVSSFVPMKASASQNIITEIDAPNVLEICPIDGTCTFTVNTTSAKLTRTAHIDFQLQFLNADGQWSMPVSKDYTEECQVEHGYENMNADVVMHHQKVLPGDFFATTLTLESGPNYSLSADQSCTLMIYNRRGAKLAEYDLVPGQNVNLSMGATIYCVVYNTPKDGSNDHSYVRILMSSDEDEIIQPLAYDINDDGTIDHDDVVCLTDLLLARPTEGLLRRAADVNGDGQITISDLVSLLSYISEHTPR